MTETIANNPATPPPARPDHVPEKFWDADGGQVRVEALSKSYSELERKLSAMIPGPKSPEWEQSWRKAMGVPEAPDAYRIVPKDDLVAPDADVNRRLHAAGFTPQQAQLVYDLAVERLVPMVQDYAEGYRAEIARERLAAEFGGAEKWAALAPQIARWGSQNLPGHVYEALAASPEGIRALHRMMSSGEPDLRGFGGASQPLDEEGLRKLMSDRRYWRDHDPAVVRAVSEGFKRLYPDRES
ncbi:MAG: hypothetical protein JNL71_03055 [Rhodospirillales bacterium]|nr:hypothetical protein [Rhodospirillales bacterium]